MGDRAHPDSLINFNSPVLFPSKRDYKTNRCRRLAYTHCRGFQDKKDIVAGTIPTDNCDYI